MNNTFFLKKLYDEYNFKQINDTDVLDVCLTNYTTKSFSMHLLFFCYKHNILIELLYNVYPTISYIHSFKQIKFYSHTMLFSYDYKSADVELMRKERETYWNNLSIEMMNEERITYMSDDMILEMALVEMTFKSHLIEDEKYQKTMDDIDEVVSMHNFPKTMILFLLYKNLLLEFLLNLIIASANMSRSTYVHLTSIYYAINYVGIKFPKNEKEVIQFWFDLDNEYTAFKTDPTKYFFNLK